MEDNFDNVPQNQETQQNEQQRAQDTGYQYSYGNNQYQPYDYTSNPAPNYTNPEDTSVMGMGDWLITILAFMIPCAGIILYFVWAFGKNGNANRKNFCRAYLICWAIEMVLFTILLVVLVGVIASTGYYYY